MDKGLSELLSKLNNSISQDDFIDSAYDLIEEIEVRHDADEAIIPILEFMGGIQMLILECRGHSYTLWRNTTREVMRRSLLIP